MGKKWKRVCQHNRWLAKKSEKAEAAAPVAPAVVQQPEAAPETPVVEEPVKATPKKLVVEAPVKASPKKSVRKSTRKSVK